MLSADERSRFFPVTRKWIYLNHAAVGPIPQYVRDAADCYLEAAATEGGKHWDHTTLLVENLRQDLGCLLNAAPDEIAFTRNASEGISVLASGLDWREGDNVILPAIEFPANVYPWLNLERRGVEVRFVPMPEGSFTWEDIAALTDPRTRVLSVSSIQFYNGFVADLAALGQFCKSRGIIFCIDAIQHIGAFPLDVQYCQADFLACGSHKWLMSGEGLGFLFCRKELAERLYPVIVGWMGVRQWEDFLSFNLDYRDGAMKFETGNLSAIGVYNLTASLKFFEHFGWPAISGTIRKLTRRIMEQADALRLPLVTPQQGNGSGIVTFKPTGQNAQVLTEKLRQVGIQVAARNGAIRLSPHFYNTQEEIDEFFRQLEPLIERGV